MDTVRTSETMAALTFVAAHLSRFRTAKRAPRTPVVRLARLARLRHP